MNENLRNVIRSLQDEQHDLFTEEDQRSQILAHLEQAHQELQGEHIQDQVAGGELRRKQDHVKSDIEVSKRGIQTEKDLLKKHISHVEELIGLLKKNIDAEERSGKEIQKAADLREDTNEKGISAQGKKLRSDNVELEKQGEQAHKTLEGEVKGTNQLIKDHDEIVRKYRETVDSFNKKLEELAQKRNQLDEQRVDVDKNQLQALNDRDVLNLEKSQSSQEVAHLTHDVKVYKDQLLHLSKKYADFLNALNKITQGQEQELKQLGDQFK